MPKQTQNSSGQRQHQGAPNSGFDPKRQQGSPDPNSSKQPMQETDGDRKGRPQSAPYHPDAKSLAQTDQKRRASTQEDAAIRQQKAAGRKQSDQI